MWYNSPFFKYEIKIILTLLIIFLGFQVLPYLYPILNYILLFFSPLILGIILYYIFRPLVHTLRQHKIPFILIILALFAILGTIVGTVTTFLLPAIITPIQSAAKTASPEKIKEATIGIMRLFNFNLFSFEELKEVFTDYVAQSQQYLFENTFNIVSTITHVAFIFVITPFCLFYFLRDDKKFHKWALELTPAIYQSRVKNALERIDDTLSNFFTGQLIISLIVTSITFISLLLLNIKNLALLTCLTFLLALIPYLGTLLAIIPPIVVGLTESYVMGFAAGAIMIAIHLAEANLITPGIMKKRFDIHPLTVILLIVGSFSLFGITGPLWITPLYALIREVFIELLQHFDENTT